MLCSLQTLDKIKYFTSIQWLSRTSVWFPGGAHYFVTYWDTQWSDLNLTPKLLTEIECVCVCVCAFSAEFSFVHLFDMFVWNSYTGIHICDISLFQLCSKIFQYLLYIFHYLKLYIEWLLFMISESKCDYVSHVAVPDGVAQMLTAAGTMKRQG